jgi:hypothetical protein
MIFAFLFVLSGCAMGEAQYDLEDGDPYNDVTTNGENETPDYNFEPTPGGTEVLSNPDIPALENRKIVYEATLVMISDDLDNIKNRVNQLLTTYEAYIDTSDITKLKYEVTVRVPSADFENFISDIEAEGEIVSLSQSAEDITNQYSNFEATYEALQTQQERVQLLLDAATDLDDILMLTNELADIDAEINQIAKQLQTYDNLVDYSTINLLVNKVGDFAELLDRSQTPSISVQEVGKDYMIVRVYNGGSNDGTVYLDVKHNGELLREYEESVYSQGYYEFTITDLQSGTQYLFEATTLENNHRISNRATEYETTEHTFFSRVGKTFNDSVYSLVVLFETIGIVLVAVSPYAVVITIFFFPGRVVYRRYIKPWRMKAKEKDMERRKAFIERQEQRELERKNITQSKNPKE